MNDYTTTVEIDRPISKVFQAISKELTHWWGKQSEVVKGTDRIFKVEWGEPWYQFKVIEYHEPELMIWECVDANQKIKGLTGVEKEWVGTKIHWQLETLGENKTLLHFKHEGLVPEFLCFDFCSKTWEHFLKGPLVEYLTATS